MSANVGAWMIACIGDTSVGGVVGEGAKLVMRLPELWQPGPSLVM